jgi:hypothetical protein
MSELTPDDVRRVFHDGAVLPIKPFKYEIRRVPVAEIHEMVCQACILRPENMAELADLPDRPLITGPRSESLENIEDIDPVAFQKALDEAAP